MTVVALDLEEVLADTMQEAVRSTDKLSADDFAEWNLNGTVWQIYAGVSDSLWRHDPLSIPPVEHGLDDYTANIYRKAERLDIVTARQHVDGSIRQWLDHHDIKYDSLVSTEQPKYMLDGYTLYVDDNPDMVGECRLLLRDYPHNRNIDTTVRKTTDRIHSLGQVGDFL
jgi:hypothetical protein